MLNLQFIFHHVVLGANNGAGFWFPSQASTVAAKVDWLYDFVLWISVISFVLIMAAMLWFMVKYRARAGRVPESSTDHNTTLEILWTVIPSIVCVFIFYFGITGYIDLRTTPPDSYEIQVTARKWSWQFTYPNGHVDSELHVPQDRNVRLIMESEDVIHSFFVPAFRVKMDVVPGRYTEVWFNATQLGDHQIFCTEYCGAKHSAMLAKAVVHEPGDFKKWLDEASDIFKNRTPVEVGQLLYKSRGCEQCHSVDGTRGIAPTLKGLFGSPRKFADGKSATADENYIRQSINEPQSQVVEGFAPVMPTFKGKLKDEEIGAIISYIKSLSGQGQGGAK